MFVDNISWSIRFGIMLGYVFELVNLNAISTNLFVWDDGFVY